MDNVLYWLWLTTKQGITHSKAARLIKYFGSIEKIYFSKDFGGIAGFSEDNINSLMNKDLSKAKYILDRTVRIGAYIVVYDEDCYPEILRHIPQPPYVLYILGKFPDMDNILTIGVVGTRNSSDYGDVVTERICTDLAKMGVITVSGLAAGIDSVSAWAAVDNGGIHAAVMGNGLDIVYPASNAELVKRVIKSGCLISEFCPGTRPFASNFPQRNRIIAGLSRGVLVTEAPEKSGALITARYALENGRDVFAVPRDITAVKYQGTNILIRSGAKLIQNAGDIVNEYPYADRYEKANISDAAAEQNVTEDNSKFAGLTGIDMEIANLLKKHDMQIDEITRELEKPAGVINTSLIMLEMRGVVKKLPGSMYQLNI